MIAAILITASLTALAFASAARQRAPYVAKSAGYHRRARRRLRQGLLARRWRS